jgi:hypothetical protein
MDTPLQTAGPLPVSRIQRFLPLLSYSLMAMGGAYAGYCALAVLREFGNAEMAGIGRIASYLTGGMWSITVGLVLALIVGFVAIIVHAAMMFSQKKTASPSALLLLLMAIAGALAPVLAWPSLVELLIAPFDQHADPQKLASSTTPYAVGAIVLGCLTPLAGLVLSFIPMRSSAGRKYGGLIVLILAEVLMLAAVVYLTMQARGITRMAMGY